MNLVNPDPLVALMNQKPDNVTKSQFALFLQVTTAAC